LRVRQLDSRESDILDISPLSRVVYKDNKFSDGTDVTQGVNFTRVVSSLKDEKWYIWEIIPAREGITGSPYTGEYMYQPDTSPIVTADGRSFHTANIHIDLRAYKICKWSSDSGCQTEGATH